MKRSSLLMLLALAPLNLGWSASFTIVNGQTETTTQTLSDDGDEGLIEDGGAIETVLNGEDGVEMLNNNQTLTNEGLISTTGNSARGVFNNLSLGVTITNSGSIETAGNDAYGIYNFQSQDTSITNSATIETDGDFAFGIYNFQSSGVDITNSGTIVTGGEQC